MATGNPFYYGSDVPRSGYVGRPEESAIVAAAKANSRLLVEGDRRTGKTSLVLHSLAGVIPVCFVNLMGVKDSSQAYNRIEDGLISLAAEAKPVRKAIEQLRSKREFSLSAGPLGTYGFKSVGSAEPARENAVFGMLRSVAHSSRIALFLDEIQDVMDMDDGKAFLGLLRGNLQREKGMPVFFAGSSRYRMHAVFDGPDAPFHRQVEKISVGPIDSAKMKAWVAGRLRSNGLALDAAAWDGAYAFAGGVAGDIQRIFYTAYGQAIKGDTIDRHRIEQAIEQILSEENRRFVDAVEPMTKTQFQVLAAIVALGRDFRLAEAARILGIAPSSAARACEALEKRGLVQAFPRAGAKVFDPFMAYWLRKLEPRLVGTIARSFSLASGAHRLGAVEGTDEGMRL